MKKKPVRAAVTHSVRAISWHCLLRWAKGGVFAESLIHRETAELSRQDRAFVQSVVLGTLRNLSWLDHLRKQLRSAPLEDDLRWLVLMGLCQLLVLGNAEHAAVSETVNCAPQRARGLINAILRNAVRRRAEFESARAELPVHLRHSMPKWLAERWVTEFGAGAAQAMMEWNTQVPPVYVRINPLNPPASIPSEWLPLEGVDGWYRMPQGLPLAELNAGQVYVADPSTRYCVQLMAPQPGERILDTCAAPGGKSAAMIAATRGQIRLLATDGEQHRLNSLRENLVRAGGEDVQVRHFDWTNPCPSEWKGAFDGVLLDVPCSNSGVLQRRVDARWRLQPVEFERLADLQLRILESACAAVAPGGRLVYSTCSIDKQEDRDVVDTFLSRHPEFELVSDYLALPHLVQADGAYAALLRKAKNA